MKTGATERIDKRGGPRPLRTRAREEMLRRAGPSPIVSGDTGRRGLAVALILATIGIVAAGLFAGKRVLALKTQINDIRHDQELILGGFRRYSAANAAADGAAAEVIFTGHIYDRKSSRTNGASSEDHLQFLRALLATRPPLAVVFGGDSIYEPNDESLRWLRDLQADLPMARFVLGNHEDVAGFWNQRPEAFSTIFHKRYWYEDLDGVRMIYLDTMASGGGKSLGAAQRAFLTHALDSTSYRYALVFLHHALWDAGVKYGLADPTPETAAALRRDWRESIVPLLVQGRVMGVFAGDADGVSEERIGGIPHHSCGWGASSPIAWLEITLGESDIRVTAHRLDRGRHLFRG